MSHSLLVLSILTSLGLGFMDPVEGGARVVQDDKTPVGGVLPDFELRTVLLGDGRVRLEEYRGQPILISYYSTVFAGMQAAAPAVRMDEEYAEKGLVTILMEIRNNKPDYMLALALQETRGYQGRLLKNQTLPFAFDFEDAPPPGLALIGVDGTLLAAGSYQHAGDVKELLLGELKKRKKGWGEHPSAKKARALAYGKDNLGGAHREVREALADEPSHEELTTVERELSVRFEALLRSVEHLVKEGELLRALQRAKDLAQAVEDDEEWSTSANELVARFDEPEMSQALGADKALGRLLKELHKRGPRKGQAEKLLAYAKKAKDPRVAERARRMAAAVQYALDHDLAPAGF